MEIKGTLMPKLTFINFSDLDAMVFDVPKTNIANPSRFVEQNTFTTYADGVCVHVILLEGKTPVKVFEINIEKHDGLKHKHYIAYATSSDITIDIAPIRQNSDEIYEFANRNKIQIPTNAYDYLGSQIPFQSDYGLYASHNLTNRCKATPYLSITDFVDL